MKERKGSWRSIVEASASDVRRLSSVWRFSSIPVTVTENTAEHSFWVALYATMILESLGRDAVKSDMLASTLLHAIVHDVAECVTGDVVRTFKYSTPELKKEVDRAEELLIKKTHPGTKRIIDLSGQLSNRNEKFIKSVVKAADFLSLFQFMRREALRGNKEICPFFKMMIHDFEVMEQQDTVLTYGRNKKFFPSFIYTEMRQQAHMVYNACFSEVEHLFE